MNHPFISAYLLNNKKFKIKAKNRLNKAKIQTFNKINFRNNLNNIHFLMFKTLELFINLSVFIYMVEDLIVNTIKICSHILKLVMMVSIVS